MTVRRRAMPGEFLNTGDEGRSMSDGEGVRGAGMWTVSGRVKGRW